LKKRRNKNLRHRVKQVELKPPNRMEDLDCPYCNLAVKAGELFCSRHSSNMRDLSSGIFFIREKRFEECDWHVTRLSLNFNFDGVQTYHAGSRQYTVNPSRYLLINEGQSFKTSVKQNDENRMLTIAFQVGLPERIYRALSSSAERMLADPFVVTDRIDFFEGVHPITDKINFQVENLIADPQTGEALQEKLNDILEDIIAEQFKLNRRALSLKKVKPATRIEIFRRLQWSLEYLQDNFTNAITVDDLANHACLSTYHFKRLFKEIYNEAPWQMIKRLRLEKSLTLLSMGLPVKEVCKSVGWADASSFVRLFKSEMNITPNQFRFHKSADA
jgi:AraC-like DNA-binding protein